MNDFLGMKVSKWGSVSPQQIRCCVFYHTVLIVLIALSITDATSSSVSCSYETSGRRKCKFSECLKTGCPGSWCENEVGHQPLTDHARQMGQRCWRKKTESLTTISTSTQEETSDTPTMTQGRSTEEVTTTFQSTSVSPLPTQYDQTAITQVPGNLVTKILITDAQKKIYLADLSTFTFQLHISLEGEPWDIDFDETGQKIYWTDISDNGLWCADIDGSNAVRIRTSTYDGPKCLAISQTSRQAFCAYEGSHVVTATDLNSPGSEMVIINPTGDNPRAIVVDDEQNVIYWTRTKGIDKAGKDGSGKSEVYNNEDLSDIDGLSVDVSGQRLLFSDSGSKKVFILNLNTNSVTELTSSYEPSDIAFFNQKLYLLNINPTAIYEVNNLDTSPTFVQHATSAYTAPRRMHIQTVIVSNLEGESEEEEEVDD